MKKLLVSISGLFTYLSLPLVAFAQGTAGVADPCTGATGLAVTLCSLGGANIGLTVRNIAVFFVVLAFVIALLYLLYGGVKWITSKGEKTEIESARNHIVAALVGLVIVILAIFLVSIVLGAFGINWTDLKIPKITVNNP